MHSQSLPLAFSSCLSLLTLLFTPAIADVKPFVNSTAYENGAYGNYTRQRFLSNEHAIAPVANVYIPPQEGVSPSKHVVWSPVGPHLPAQHAHPMVLDADTLSLTWFGPAHGGLTMGPEVKSCNGTDYLTFFAGSAINSRSAGNFYMYNSKYELVYNVSAVGNLAFADAHEIFLTPQCTVVITIFQPHHWDLSAYNITDGWIIDSYFQEIDLATGKLLFQWTASDHVPIGDAIWSIDTIANGGKSKQVGFDYFHLNSVEKDRFGNYLLSARHTCALYYISGETGNVIWSVGGKKTYFTDISDGKASDFQFQHHARWANPEMTHISLYDDRNSVYHRNKDPISRGMIISLDYARKEVKLEKTYKATHGIHSFREGNMQMLQDSPSPGNVLVGYGDEPAWTEFAANGTILWDVAFGPFHLDRFSVDNYRAQKVNWTGTPTWSPSIAPGPQPNLVFNKTKGIFHQTLKGNDSQPLINDTAYFSWNGATEIRSWVVLTSNDTAELEVEKHFWEEVPKSGFEDSVFVGAGTKYVLALAVDDREKVLGYSTTMDMSNFGTNESATSLTKLNAEWRALVAKKGNRFGLDKLHKQWTYMRTEVLAPLSTPIKALIGTVITFAVLSICSIPMCIRMSRRRRYTRLGQMDFVLDGEKDVLAFSVEVESDGEDGGSEAGDSYYDDHYYRKDAKDGGDIGASRSCSGSSTLTASSKGSELVD